jgi:lipopolysaccharide export system permease protein
MTRFDRHIMARLVKTFVLFTGALIVFFVVLHWVEYSDDFLDGGASAWEIFSVYYPSYVPEIVRLTSPLAIFLACIHLTGKLAQELQLTALQTGGVSLYRLMVPYVVVGVVLSAGMFGFNGWIVPKTNATVVEYDKRYIEDAPAMDVSEVMRQNGPSSVVTVGYYDRKRQIAHRVSLQRFASPSRLAERHDAIKMTWQDSARVWHMEYVTLRRFAADTLVAQRTFATLDTTLAVLPRDFARTARDADAMTIPDAADYVAALRRSGASRIGRTLVAYYTKFSYPLANLVLVLVAVPLASVRRRGGQAAQFGLGLMTAFVYLALQKLTEPFGYTGDLSPMLTAWLPHAVFFVIALLIAVRTRK